AALCEKLGADAKDVERGLKSEARIGRGAYLAPGAAFAGGTLARDVAFLNQLSVDAGIRAPLLQAVKPSNDNHRQWPHRKLEQVVGRLEGKTIAVWGLTYKPGTDTLRRSSAVELCRWLLDRGASVRAHDPAVAKPLMMAAYSLRGRTAIVTGANQGLGKAIARAYVQADANVVLCARGEELLARAAADLNMLGAGRIVWLAADVAKEADVRRVV